MLYIMQDSYFWQFVIWVLETNILIYSLILVYIKIIVLEVYSKLS